MTIPPYAVATFLTILLAVLSERTSQRAYFIMGSSSLSIIGYIVLLTSPSAGVSYFGTILAAAGIYPATALVLAWPANNVSGQTKRATASATQISIGNLGAILGTQLYRPATAPEFYLGHEFALGYLVANVLVVGGLREVLRRENERREKILAEVEDKGVEKGGEAEKVGAKEEAKRGDDRVEWRFQL